MALLALVTWVVLSVVIALAIGRSLHLADRRFTAFCLRNPSGVDEVSYIGHDDHEEVIKRAVAS
jgi:hypothetical protein